MNESVLLATTSFVAWARQVEPADAFITDVSTSCNLGRRAEWSYNVMMARVAAIAQCGEWRTRDRQVESDGSTASTETRAAMTSATWFSSAMNSPQALRTFFFDSGVLGDEQNRFGHRIRFRKHHSRIGKCCLPRIIADGLDDVACATRQPALAVRVR